MTGIPNGLFHGKMILISGTPTAPTRYLSIKSMHVVYFLGKMNYRKFTEFL